MKAQQEEQKIKAKLEETRKKKEALEASKLEEERKKKEEELAIKPMY